MCVCGGGGQGNGQWQGTSGPGQGSYTQVIVSTRAVGVLNPDPLKASIDAHLPFCVVFPRLCPLTHGQYVHESSGGSGGHGLAHLHHERLLVHTSCDEGGGTVRGSTRRIEEGLKMRVAKISRGVNLREVIEVQGRKFPILSL